MLTTINKRYRQSSFPLTLASSSKRFYKGFLAKVLIWFAYPPNDEFANSYKFIFELVYGDPSSMAIFQCIIKPGLLLVEFWHGRDKPPTSYEFYNPVVAARQLGLG